MKTFASPRFARRSALAGSIAAILASHSAAQAQFVWDGGGANGSWNTAANWVGDTVPGNDASLTFSGSLNLLSNNNVDGLFNLTGLTFDSNAGAFTLTGNDLTLSGNITNSSNNEQKLSFNSLTLSTAAVINTETAASVVNITTGFNASASLTKNGAGTLKITNPGGGQLGGGGGGAFVVNQGNVLLDGGETASYTVSGSEMWIGSTANQNASLTLNTGELRVDTWFAVARGNGTGTVSSDVVLNGTSTLTAQNFSVGYNANNAANTPKGTITLNDSSSLTITNGNDLFIFGESAGSNATLRLNGSSTLSQTAGGSRARIGASGKGLINIASPTATLNLNQVFLGSATGGAGAIWNRGTLTVSSGASTDHFALGQAVGAYGYYLHDSATPLTLQEVGIGGAGGGNGVMEIRSGTVAAQQWVTMSRTNGANAVSSMLLLSGGTLTPNDAIDRFRVGNNGGAGQYALIDVGSGSRIAGGANTDINLLFTGNNDHVTVLNVHDGGSVEALRVFAGNQAGSAVVNLNGGKLVATGTNNDFLNTNVDVFIQSVGGTIDTNGFNSVVNAQVFAPTGNGLTSIPLAAGGSGYIGRPIVKITGGGGAGATAIANFSEVTGEITGITITSAGSGYTSVPTIELVGGGGTGATLGTATLGAVASGGALSKIGAGTLTLGRDNTYGGGTTINGGTLAVTNTTGSGTGTGIVTVNAGGFLGGSGTATGPVTVNTGGGVAPGVGQGTLTVGSITFAADSLLHFEITDQTVGDRLTVTTPGGLVINGGDVSVFVPGSTTSFSANGVYNLIGYTGAIGGTGVSALSVTNSIAGKSYAFGENGGFVTLTIATTGSTPSFWNVDADGTWSTGSNWAPGGAPNSAGATANFGGGGATITAPRTVMVNTGQTVGSIGFNSAQPYTIAGTSAITLNNGAVPNAEITTTNGSHTISTPLIAASAGTQVTVTNGADTLTLSGAISGNTTLSKLGPGTLVLGGANTYTGATTVFAGTLEIAGNGSIGSSLTINNGARLRLAGGAVTLSKPLTFDLGGAAPTGISGFANGTANFTLIVPTGTTATVASAINISSGSQLKLGGGTLKLTNSGANVLANVGGLAYVVQEGNLEIDGGAASTYDVTGGELAIGDDTPNQVSLTLKSGTLNVGTWTSVGRGNGNTGLQSTLNVTGGTLNTLNLFTGYSHELAGYNARPVINISGSGVVNATNTADRLGVRLGESGGSFSTLNVSDSASLTSAGDFQVGYGGTAVVNLTGNATINTAELGVGHGTGEPGSQGVGVFNQAGGTVQQAGGAGGDWRIGGHIDGDDVQTYGAYILSGGQLNTGGRNFQIGANGRGILDIKGGTATSDTGFPVVGRFVGSQGLLNISSGSFNQLGTGNLFIIGEAGSGVVNVSGTGSLVVAGEGFGPGPLGGTGGLRLGHVAGGSGILNVNGGTVTTTGITESNADGSSFVYLNGGTIKASTFNATFMQGLDNVVVGPGGAIFDTNSNDITVGQNLSAPTGQGLANVPLTAGGAGYLAQPIVEITGGGGTGATAVATVAGGVVTGVTITNPGIGYTSAPTVNLLGGGATTAATIDGGAIGLAANVTTGGLTKRGDGALTLSGANTYAGPTAVENGTLIVDVAGSITSNVSVTNSASLEVMGSITGSVNAGPAAAVRGAGTINGPVTIQGLLQPGVVGGLGTLTLVNDPLSLANGSTTTFELFNKNPGDFDRVVGIDQFTLAGTISISLIGGFQPQMGDSFDLIDFNTIDASGFNLASELVLPALNPGLFWNTNEFLSSGVLVVVPEPTAALALLGASGLLAGFRRFRRR